jgi:hypothetical protein
VVKVTGEIQIPGVLLPEGAVPHIQQDKADQGAIIAFGQKATSTVIQGDQKLIQFLLGETEEKAGHQTDHPALQRAEVHRTADHHIAVHPDHHTVALQDLQSHLPPSAEAIQEEAHHPVLLVLQARQAHPPQEDNILKIVQS